MNLPSSPSSPAAPAAPAAPASPASPALGSSSKFEGLCRLEDWGLIRAQGEDCFKFLHGQLTQSVEGLPDDVARLSGYCSPKGRLLATAVMWKQSAAQPSEEAVLLACSADVLPATLKRLSMFVMRAKCKLSDVSAEQPLWGIVGAQAASAVLPTETLSVWAKAAVAEGVLVRLPDAVIESNDQPMAVPRYLLAGKKPTGLTALEAGIWPWLEVHSATARIVAATAEQFVPQMVNLELVGGVNFQKGCFPGQEVVARSQYRGTMKRRAFVLHGGEPMQPGQEVFHSEDPGQPAGMVALAGSWPGAAKAHAALAELKLAALESGSLHLGSADGPALLAGTLPYALPTAQEA